MTQINVNRDIGRFGYNFNRADIDSGATERLRVRDAGTTPIETSPVRPIDAKPLARASVQTAADARARVNNNPMALQLRGRAEGQLGPGDGRLVQQAGLIDYIWDTLTGGVGDAMVDSAAPSADVVAEAEQILRYLETPAAQRTSWQRGEVNRALAEENARRRAEVQVHGGQFEPATERDLARKLRDFVRRWKRD